MPPRSTTPRGFSLTLDLLLKEQESAATRDRNQRNIFTLNGASSFCFRVMEELVSFANHGRNHQDNSSLQGTELFVIPDSPPTTYAALLSTFPADARTYSLRGYADGTVSLHVATPRRPEEQREFIITEQAMLQGITAAGIRRTQHDITWDGEISRPEQAQIIGLVKRAKVLAEKR